MKGGGKGKQDNKKKDQATGPAAQMKISSFFQQRKQQFTQQKSLSDRSVVSPTLGKRKVREESEQEAKDATTSSSPPSSHVEAKSIETVAEEVQHRETETEEVVVAEVKWKKARVVLLEDEEHSGSDTEEDEEIRTEYEEMKSRVSVSKQRATSAAASRPPLRGEEEEEVKEKGEEKPRAMVSPTSRPRLVHANTVSNLKELKRRSPASAAKLGSALLARSPEARLRGREEETSNKEQGGKAVVEEEDRSRTRLRKETRTEQGHTIQVRHGDITAEVVGAVVNAANSHLAHGGGVAGAISRAGGREVQVESDRWVRQHGEVATGEVAVTGPGRMECDYIIHAVGPICFSRENMAKKDKELAAAVLNSLLKAEELELRSISLPAISSGIFGYPKKRCAEVMFSTALAFCRDHPDSRLRQIRFTNWDMETVTIFEQEFAKRFNSN